MVGMVAVGSFVREPSVKLRGPIPIMPSTPVEKPNVSEATPIDCPVIVSPPPRETVSVYSVPNKLRINMTIYILMNSIPEKKPEPYNTNTASLVL